MRRTEPMHRMRFGGIQILEILKFAGSRGMEVRLTIEPGKTYQDMERVRGSWIRSRTKKVTCRACGGIRLSTKMRLCIPCVGTGQLTEQPNVVEVKSGGLSIRFRRTSLVGSP